MILKVSVTTLESYRRYLMITDETEPGYQSYESFVNDLAKRTLPNIKMQVGTAYHKIIEDPSVCLTSDEHGNACYEAEGIQFLPDLIEPIYKYRSQYPKLIHEAKFYKEYLLPEPVLVSGKADGLFGNEIHEHKTTTNGDYDKYCHSMQWRYYFDLLPGAQKVIYNVFEFNNYGENPENINRVNYFSYEMFRYNNLEKDCISLLKDFVNFIHQNKLEYLFLTIKPHTTYVR